MLGLVVLRSGLFQEKRDRKGRQYLVGLQHLAALMMAVTVGVATSFPA